jgi:hypothetical protein
MKHPYRADCPCGRCTREQARRTRQAAQTQTAPRVWLTRRREVTALERWARRYYDTEGGCDQFNPEDR